MPNPTSVPHPTERILEVCAASLESVMAAKAGGAKRIELCSALSEDGLTPSYGMIEAARRLGPERLHVLIRPRGGDFVYSEAEVECMVCDIKVCRTLGVDGVVIGALTEEGDIDIEVCRRLVEAAEGMQITFHRAFDQCREPLKALKQIMTLGCHRLLTSGQAPTAMQGIPLINTLVSLVNTGFVIMPGAGVNEDNAAEILSKTGTTEIHGSLRSMTPKGMETNPEKVRTLIQRINEL